MNYSGPFERISRARWKTHPLPLSLSARKGQEYGKIREGKEAVFQKQGAEEVEIAGCRFQRDGNAWQKKKKKKRKEKENARRLKFSRGSREPRERDNLVNEKPSGYVISWKLQLIFHLPLPLPPGSSPSFSSSFVSSRRPLVASRAAMPCQTKLRMHAARWRRRRWAQCDVDVAGVYKAAARISLLNLSAVYTARRARRARRASSTANGCRLSRCGRFLVRCRTIIAASGDSSRTNDRSSRTTC